MCPSYCFYFHTITLFFRVNIGEPDEPDLVLQLCLNLYFLPSYAPIIKPNDKDNFPQGIVLYKKFVQYILHFYYNCLLYH